MSSASHKQIQAWIYEIESRSDAPIVSLYDQIKDKGLELGLLEYRVTPIERVGVHRHNRDGVMVSGKEAMLILTDVIRVGVSMDLLKDATAFAEPQSRVNVNAFIAKTDADKLLARYNADQILVSSVACSHFNQALAAVKQGVHYDNQMLSSADGRLSQEKICQKYPVLIPIFEHGLNWAVWSVEAESLFPSLANIAQRALNTKYSVQQGQDTFQLYIRAVRALNNPTIPNRDRVAYAVRDLVKLNARCHPDIVPFIVESARKFGGGDDQFINHLIDYCACYKVAGREVAASSWKALAAMKFDTDHLCPNFFVSILMCIAGHPTRDACQAADISRFPNKGAKDIIKAEKIINQAMALCTAMQVKHEHQVEHMGSLRATLVLKIIGRTKALAKPDISLETIASTFYTKIKEFSHIDQPNPWEEHTPIVTPSTPATMDIQNVVVKYDALGHATNSKVMVMQQRGFAVGTMIKHKQTGDCRS